MAGRPVKGVYFFPGERGANDKLYTVHPTDPRDERWNSDPKTRPWVMDRMVKAHLNTVVMSYWSNMPQWSPMALDATSLVGVLDAVEKRPLTILPAIEGGHAPQFPQVPQWELSREFPRHPKTNELAPGLLERIGWLVELFAGKRRKLWVQIYDRDGLPRHAIHLMHVCSHVMGGVPESKRAAVFAEAFDAVAQEAEKRFGVRVGFTLDAIGGQPYSPYPKLAGAILERIPAVLAIQGFASEVFSGLIKNGPPGKPHDNNKGNLEQLLKWRRETLNDWIATGIPVYLDISNGFDGRIVWGGGGTGFWGDNSDYTEDRWRNGMSLLKGPGVRGMVFNTWNGYTEGYAAVPTKEHGNTVYEWLADVMKPQPWEPVHTHYTNGKATYKVSGAIRQKWIELGGELGFGAPTGPERRQRGGKIQTFTGDHTIYWSKATGATEVK